jgi:hypothetical protein
VGKKMSELSNKTIVILLVVALVISIGGTLLSLNKVNQITGMITSAGNVTLTITSLSSVNVTVKTVNFGSGYVDAACNNCTMDTLGSIDTACCKVFSVTGQTGLVVENSGNTNLSILANFDRAALAFLGGSIAPPKFKMMVLNNESGSCVNSTDSIIGTIIGAGINETYRSVFADVVTGDNLICRVLTPDQTNDTIRLHFNVTVPGNAPAKAGNSTVTITGTDV